MITYEQATGILKGADGTLLGTGYSGHNQGKNNPALESVSDEGPIPRGIYTIEPPHDSATHGPFVMALDPDSTNQMFGRSGFLMHGDSVIDPGAASLGCVVMPYTVRKAVWASGDHTLEVVEGTMEGAADATGQT